MEIELLYVYGCPHVRTTLDRLNSILQVKALNCSIVQTEVRDHEAARSVAFLGSPSVRINGIDIEAPARKRTDFGIMCRMDDGKGVPPESLMQSAIAEARRLLSNPR